MAKTGLSIFRLHDFVCSLVNKRLQCILVFKGCRELAVRVEEFSQKPYYLAVKFLYQGGQTEIVGVDVATVGSANWGYMSRNYGAVWDTSRVPEGPLQFRWIVTGGYDGKYVWAKNVLPQDWSIGQVYDSGVQITDVAQEGCSACDKSKWK